MEIPLGMLAQLLGGELTDPSAAETIVNDVKPLDRAGPSALAFLWDPAFAKAAESTNAGCVVTKEPVPGRVCLLVADPQQAMLQLLNQVYGLRHPDPAPGVHPQAFVDPSATLGEGVSVGPNATIDANTTIGANTQVRANAYVGRHVTLGEEVVIHPNATVLDHVQVGDRTVIWSGAIVGKDGFGFVPRSGDRRDLSQGSVRIPQIGGVKIGAEVEIGALTTVARGALEDTIVEDHVIVDDQVHIAHGCHVKHAAILIGRVALAGKVEIGEEAYLLQGSAVGLGRKVGPRAIIGGGAQVLYKDVGELEEVLGWPSRPAMRERRLQITLDKLIDQLPDLRKRVKKLERLTQPGD